MSDSESDDECIQEIEQQLVILSDTIESLLTNVETFEKELIAMERPIENIALAQLGDIPYLITSPFREATFSFRSPGLPGIELSRQYSFRDICELLRSYLFRMNLIDADETIHMNDVLKNVFQTQEATTTYLNLIAKLRTVLI
jgi:hypothetical protein